MRSCGKTRGGDSGFPHQGTVEVPKLIGSRGRIWYWHRAGVAVQDPKWQRSRFPTNDEVVAGVSLDNVWAKAGDSIISPGDIAVAGRFETPMQEA